MKYRERVAEIADVVRALDGSGLVHARSKLTLNWSDFIREFRGDDGAINGWEVTRRRHTPTTPDLTEIYVLRKYRGVHDDSESDFAFQENIDAVTVAFRDLHNLSFGSIPFGLVVQEIDERMFGDVLCHFAMCELQVLSDLSELE